MFHKIISFIQRFPVAVITAAVVLSGVGAVYGGNIGNYLQGDGFAAAESESTRVSDQIDREFGENKASMLVVFSSKNGEAAMSEHFSTAVKRELEEAGKKEGVTGITSYYSTGAESLLSQDKTKALALVTLAGDDEEQAEHAEVLREGMKSDTLGVQFGGSTIADMDITEQISSDLAIAETISFSVLAVLLVIVFRGVIAALLPLLLGGVAIVGAIAVLKLIAGVTPIVEYAMNVIILLGLGLAVDYSLLMVSRFREELYNFKNDTKKALAKTYHTAGRTVFFSGLTVIISLLALVVFPLDFLRSMGYGGAAAVAVAMVAALVILPALLRVLGPRVNWLSFGSAKRLHKAADKGEIVEAKKSIWYKTGAFFMRHSASTLVVSVGLLAVTALPALHMYLASPDEKVLPRTAEARQVTEVLKTDFAMNTTAIDVLYTAPSLTDEKQIGALYDYTRNLEKLPGVTKVESVVTLSPELTKENYQQLIAHPDAAPEAIKKQLATSTKGNTTRISITNDFETSSEKAKQLVADIRSGEKPSGVNVQVGGFTAELADQLVVLAKYLPYAAAIIIVTLFILLFFMLGSVVIPIKAMLQNLLSLGAAFGILVLLFQEGFLANVLHINDTGVIYATLPAMIFAIAFGLSMDYSVFLYSRIKEQYDKTGDTDEAVLLGLQKTGGIITSAAMLLFVVVVAFATSGIAIMQQIGVGLALAILLDAFIVRMVLVPATMKLLGKYTWWAPRSWKRLQEKLGLGEKE